MRAGAADVDRRRSSSCCATAATTDLVKDAGRTIVSCVRETITTLKRFLDDYIATIHFDGIFGDVKAVVEHF